MRKSKSSVSSARRQEVWRGRGKIAFATNPFQKSFKKVVDKCLQCEYNYILSSPKSERLSEAQRAGSKPFVALGALVSTENFLKKFEKVLDRPAQM